ncbi:AraC family transcriptional regulator [Chitinophaga lutea]|uniref:AraC family transcriptional regulator n=1 Tax=Chitinophaga lutea TaxID=2488634 RepID=A0A3N4QBS0_9BACT|nr:helix-turn-helix domain-containing protein [Chitinophaga lutea]RPE13417.1 AraC family transcriptional regulator [Chitinophaga lutea]
MTAPILFRYFVIAGLINTALFTFLLLTHKRNSTATLLLMALMLLVSFQALLNGFDTRAFFMANPHLSRVSWLQLSLFGPLIYLMVKKLTVPPQRLQWNDAIHAAPFLAYCIILWPWLSQPAAEKRRLLSDFEALSRHDFGWLNQVSLLMLFFYLLLSLRQFRQYRSALENTFSEISRRRQQWLQQFLYAILAVLVISGLGFYGRKWDIPFISWFYHYNYVIVVGMVYWLAYKCLTQPDIFMPGSDGAMVRYRKSGLAATAAPSMYGQLLLHMETAKPYLDPDLTIYTLAEALNMQRHHLSQLINERSGSSFYDFINGYRVEAVKSRLKDPASGHLTILGIAFECGFNSKATFNTTFRKFTGLTPSAYRKADG